MASAQFGGFSHKRQQEQANHMHTVSIFDSCQVEQTLEAIIMNMYTNLIGFMLRPAGCGVSILLNITGS